MIRVQQSLRLIKVLSLIVQQKIYKDQSVEVLLFKDVY